VKQTEKITPRNVSRRDSTKPENLLKYVAIAYYVLNLH